jgi:hypothetical protein
MPVDVPAPDRPVALDAPVDVPAPDAPSRGMCPWMHPWMRPWMHPWMRGLTRVGVWTPMAAPPAPLVGRSAHTAVWTGSEMLVFGGQNAFVGAARLDTGARYAPATNTWRTMATAGARARARHTAVWTGRVMLVWGGRPNDSDSAGEAYNPVTDTWTSLASEGAPAARMSGHSAVWTGTEMIVWGGLSATSTRLNTGGSLRPRPRPLDPDVDRGRAEPAQRPRRGVDRHGDAGVGRRFDLDAGGWGGVRPGARRVATADRGRALPRRVSARRPNGPAAR